jgi:Ca-activated chloride channel family protein
MKDRAGDTALFLDTSEAYEILSDPQRRDEYDAQLLAHEERLAGKLFFQATTFHSRANLLLLDEPQIHYLLLKIRPASSLPAGMRAPINLCLVVDQSKSMEGLRLDQVRGAALSILKQLQATDSVSVVAFGDKAQIIVTPEQARDISLARAALSHLQAGGGTEIGQGLLSGLASLQETFTQSGINHLVLFTDGRTYGDEELCLRLASEAAQQQIAISAIGIGGDWNDRFLDTLVSITGGSVTFMDSPRTASNLLQQILNSLERVSVRAMRMESDIHPLVDLRSVFRLLPEPMPLGETMPMQLGHLPSEGEISLLFEMVIQPLEHEETITLAHIKLVGEVLGGAAEEQSLPLTLRIPIASRSDPAPPPQEILSALSAVTLYRMQESARREVELGQHTKAARRLERLSTHLLSAGERKLAKAALYEAARLRKSKMLSNEGEKTLKYGTRALLLPGGKEET